MENIIELGTVEDSHELSLVHVKSWQESYAQLLEADFLATLDPNEREKNWRDNFLSPDFEVFIARNEKQAIIGFASLATRQYHGQPCLFLKGLYLLKAYQKEGIGRALFLRARGQAKKRGATTLYIEVLKANPSLGFYQKFGAQLVEENVLQIGTQFLPEVILGLQLKE